MQAALKEADDLRAGLKENEERLQTVFEHMSEGLVISDLSGQLIHWNRASLQMHDFASQDEVLLNLPDFTRIFELSKPDGTVLPVEEWPLSRVIRGEPVRDLQICIRRLDKDWKRTCSFNGALVSEPGGRQLAFVTITDLTRRLLAEAELQKFVSLAKNSSEFIGMCDLAGKPFFINQAGLELVGLDDLQQALNTPVTEFFFPEDQAFIRDEFFPQVLQQGRLEKEIRFRHFRTGEPLWMIYNVFVVRDAHGEVVAFATVSPNITDRRLAEEKIRQLNAELEQRVAERTEQLESANKELESFSYSVSHDLRSPLRAMDGFSQAVLEDFGAQLPDEGRRYLQTIREGAQRMGLLIDDLLRFSRLSRLPLNRMEVPIDNLVRSVLDDLISQEKDRKIDLRIGSLPPTSGDPSLLKQVWINLVSNALKYTRRREVAALEIGSKPSSEGTVYFIRDNGTGFDMRYAGKLFGVFQRLHRAEEYEGTGVGLALVQRIIHRHGGRIWAEAEVDRGATFFFTLQQDNP
ncbi:MAG: sensor histidine kinase [Terrimicrobiaceae bacterium]